MEIAFEIDRFVLSDIDYELMQTILLGITSERKRMSEKLSNISSCLYSDYSDEQKQEFKILIAYIKEKETQLNEIVYNCNSYIENIPI
jgi:hypothetical protein|tara:strand:- start:810 stop:1073 length:264 start_codon:yes stop_codon:yes gene_type:complete